MPFLSAEQAAQLQATGARLATLAEFRFLSETMYCWNGAGRRVIAGREYLGLGSFGEIDGLSQMRTTESSKITARLSSLTPEIAAIAANSTAEVAGRLALVSLQIFDTDWQPAGPPIPMFWGTMQRLQIVRREATERDGGMRVAELEIENPFVARSQAANGLYSDADQRARYPTDLFCRWVPRQQVQVVTWPDL